MLSRPCSFAQDGSPPKRRHRLALAPAEGSLVAHHHRRRFRFLSYEYNTNQPYNRLNQFRVFDFNDDEPQLDMAQLVIQRAIEKPNQFGFRFNMIAGSAVPEVTAAYGMFRKCRRCRQSLRYS